MIEKLDKDCGKLQKKINELVDAVNELQKHEEQHLDLLTELNEMRLQQNKKPAENVLTMVDNQVTANLPNIDAGELAFLSKENSDLKDEIDRLETELDRTRKALDVANEKLRHCVNITVEELDELKGNLLITYDALLHFSKDPIANKALEQITALEQKDK